MFDYKEIARRALLRAEEIKARRRRGYHRLGVATVALGAGILVIVVFSPMLNVGEKSITEIEDERIPLGAPLLREARAIPYGGTEPEIIIPYINTVSIPAETLDIGIQLFNSGGNPCSLIFKIFLAETKELLYLSGMVEPGMSVDNISLIKDLPKGEYPAILMISAIDSESMSIMVEIAVDIKILKD